MRPHSSHGDQFKAFYSHDLGMNLNVIDREAFSNFDRWSLILMLSQTYSPDEPCFDDGESHKILLKDLKCPENKFFDLNDPAIFGFLEILKLSQYDLNTITLWNVWGAISELHRADAIGVYDIHSGINKILKASIRDGGLNRLDQFLKACKLESLKDKAALPLSSIIDPSEKYKKSGYLYQNVISLISEDKQELDSDYAFFEFDMAMTYISSSIESCYKKLSLCCNTARQIHGTAPDEEEHYSVVVELIYISCNGERVIEFSPNKHIKLLKENDISFKDYKFKTVFTGENPDLMKKIMSTNDTFHRKIRGKILENDLGM